MKRLSLCLIVGDAHVGVLARCLMSILDRPEGPAADELVIGWNGEKAEDFRAALERVFGDLSGISDIPPMEGVRDFVRTFGRDPIAAPLAVSTVRVVVHRGLDPKAAGFNRARDENFGYATGEWRMYVDADDVLCDTTHPAYADSMEQDPPPTTIESFPVKGTLPEFVDGLPPHINVIKAPYNYLNSDKLRPLIRNKRPRIVRWDPYWTWANPIHEQLIHLLDREFPVWTPGIVLFHDPPVTEVERTQRNFDVLDGEIKRLEAMRVDLPHNVLYGQAIYAMGVDDYATAVGLLERAMVRCTDRELCAVYGIKVAQCHTALENFAEAQKAALAVVGIAPDRPEGYLLAAEASFHARNYEDCVRWYEAGGTKPMPSGALTDQRLERCLVPTRSIGQAYLRLHMYEQALAVAEIGLKEANDGVALRLKVLAQEGLAYRALGLGAIDLAGRLSAAGFGVNALKVLDAVEPAITDRSSFDEIRTKVKRRLTTVDLDSKTIPPGSKVCEWFATAPPDDVCITLPLDAADEPEVFLTEVAKTVKPGAALRCAVTDPASGDPYAMAVRALAMDAEALLRACDKVGETSDLMLSEDAVDVAGQQRRFLVAQVKPGRPVAPWKPDITFWAPVAAESWGPWRLLRHGMGGSEEAVVYLAREFAQRGFNVQVYAVLDAACHRGVHVEGGVRWRHIDSFDPLQELPGIAIACRAPWAVRFPAFARERLYVWHQDAAYPTGWSVPIARAVRNLYVSKWQRGTLLRQLGAVPESPTALIDSTGVVCGDAIPQSAIDVPFDEAKRDPLSAVYISSPLRGLRELLTIWPAISGTVPGATLRVYYGWQTTPRMYRRFQDQAMDQIRRTPGVEWVGRISQLELEVDLVKRGVWAYPCLFPEGWAMSGMRASAAGLVPVYRRVAALPEIQYPSPYSVPDTDWDERGGIEFIEAACKALEDSRDGKVDREAYRRFAAGKTWAKVAEAIIADFARRGLLGTQKEEARG